MHQLVYISTLRSETTLQDLTDILHASMRNNKPEGITGLLVRGGNRFLQALEGPTDAVLRTFERIQKDPRHFGCVVLTSRSVAQRAFGDWSMAFEDCNRRDGTLQDLVTKLLTHVTDVGVRAEFESFAERHSAAA